MVSTDELVSFLHSYIFPVANAKMLVAFPFSTHNGRKAKHKWHCVYRLIFGH